MINYKPPLVCGVQQAEEDEHADLMVIPVRDKQTLIILFVLSASPLPP